MIVYVNSLVAAINLLVHKRFIRVSDIQDTLEKIVEVLGNHDDFKEFKVSINTDKQDIQYKLYRFGEYFWRCGDVIYSVPSNIDEVDMMLFMPTFSHSIPEDKREEILAIIRDVAKEMANQIPDRLT